MRRKFLAIAATIMTSVMMINAEKIKLPEPEAEGGLPVNEALAQRQSIRDFDPDKQIPMQTISNLLWATCGINRTESGLRTNPTARNFQEITVYLFDNKGVYLYDPKEIMLVKIVDGDYRELVAGAEFKQEFVLDAPVSLVIVADTAKSGLTASLVDAGIACENLNLFCAGNGLATVPRMAMDVNGIQKLLSLPETSLPVLNNPLGFKK